MTSPERVNAAAHLARSLRSWMVPNGQTPEHARGDQDARAEEFWTPQHRAVDNLAELTRAIRELELQGEDVGAMRMLLPDLYRAVFAVNTPWGATAGDRQTLTEPQFQSLSIFGVLLNLRATARVVNDDARARIVTSLTEARDLVSGSDAGVLDLETKSYLLTLLDHAIAVLASNRPPWEQRSAVQGVSGALLGVAAQPGGTPQQRTFRQKIGRYGLVVAIGLASQFSGGTVGHVAELTVDGFLSNLEQGPPPQLELGPGSTPLELEQGRAGD